MRPFLLLALLLLPAAAADDAGMLRLNRLAMEAQIRIGDTLRQKGDREGARIAYEEALRLENGPLRGGPAVRLALRWLAAHQDPDGKWDCDGFMKHDPAGDKCDGAGGAHYDIGVTGLALLSFLRAGYGHEAGVRMGLDFLAKSQQENGCFGSRVTSGFMYNHAVATLAMCEGYRLTRDERDKAAAAKGIDFLLQARNPYLAWRYEPRGGDNDTSVTAWCVLALRAGQEIGLEVEGAAYDGARVWFEKMTDERGQVGYLNRGGPCARPEGKQDRFPPDRSQALTAAAIAARLAMGDPPATDAIRSGANLCLALPPVWNPDDGSIDMYYWFHATEAMARIGGGSWTAWRGRLEEALIRSQHPKGARAGSWDPIDPWGEDGGRVYSTALMALSLAAEPLRKGPR
ncbi:MAG: prenyltransferase/squalene oxidase repeat-containing protein [Planctomycetota bacterium]